ncbi:hypothetical protein HK104_002682 [Borealophlyctis nickersoniae]|nr:hypothetical protein HK104_002682 [Borealophlyctis nickersoniae]
MEPAQLNEKPQVTTNRASEPGGGAEWQSDGRIRLEEESGKYVYTGDDGTAYEWDEEKNAWFPRYDEYLVQMQQSAYGVEGVPEEAAPVEPRAKRKKIYTYDDPVEKKPKVEKKKPNTAVYVTGLPSDTTVEEMKEVFEKYGLLMVDINTGEPRVKLYKDAEGKLKGDALVMYFKEESVPLACNLLDDTDFRLGQASKIRVQPAVFQEKEKPPSDANNEKGSAKNGKKIDKKRAQKALHNLERRLEWFDDSKGKKSDKFAKIVVLKHMFTLEELEEDPTLLLDLKEDVRTECEKFGEVTNVVLYDLEKDGVMTVRFKDVEGAIACIKKMNGRFFAGRRVEASHFDGQEKFKESRKESTEEDEKKRLEAYEKWLESQH